MWKDDMAARYPRDASISRSAAVKVPQITAVFWLIKILTTGMGEATADYLATVNLALTAIVGVVGLTLTLQWQLRARRYVAQVYWSTVAMVAVFGTMAADAAHIVLGLPYAVTTVGGVLAVAAAFWLWWRTEGTLSIHSIVTVRREAFYWATVLATFALGTAVGDLSALTLHLGFFPSALLFTGIIAVPAVAWRWAGMNPVFAFWFAYVITRPLGASVADWLGKPHSLTGLGSGDGTVAIVSIVILVAVVGAVALQRGDISLRAQPSPLPATDPVER